ncbi:hypothetical protein [Oerskovia sp. KBS0722]|uniref:hypothetical protein n=1 Tax=Oerskovia sp. KBS0722 TaxID=1179673 RepID=UPI00110D4C3C|nr:hypothetical protein [Oerskovia sp. KBS0722]QDW62328.1 hypothetical protein FFI11_007090 [Oerskovia sp. KBS0722]
MIAQTRNVAVLGTAAKWCRIVAAVLGMLGVANLIAWANRWYVTTLFARSLDSEDADFARVVYERMEQVHETLLAAALLLLAAGAAATLGSRLANRIRRSGTAAADTTV